MPGAREQRSGRRAFLVERYLPPAAGGDLAASVAGLARACGDASGGADGEVRYLQSVYLPTDDVCFCLFSAGSPDAVRAANDRAGFSLDRISEAVLLLPHPLQDTRST